MRLVTTILIFALSMQGQQVGQNAPSESGTGTATFSTGTQLVVETITVTDKQGHAVDGLTAKDFTVSEDAVPQPIRFFEHQKLPEAPMTPVAAAEYRNIKIYDKLGKTQIAPEPSGGLRYKDRRLLALYFDMTAMQPAEQVRALEAANKFIQTQMTSADFLAVLRYQGGAVDVLQDFTDDRNRLLSIIETITVGEGQGFGESTSDDSTSDAGAAFGQNDTEFNIFNTDRQLSALQTAAIMLSRLREKKLLIYFGGGLHLNGLNNQAQLHATINAAIRAGVSFWPIDARGLVAHGPLGDATKGSPGGIGMYSGAAALALTSNFQQSQDTLYALAGDTGGKALLDYNDLTKGMVEAQRAVSSYYIIGYYTSNTAQDGKFRRVKISLNGNLSASLDYRQGYFAGKAFSKFTAADKERQLEDALMLSDPITELSIAMEVDYFQMNRAEYFVPVMVKIPGHELALAKRGGSERTRIDFLGEIKDEYGTTIRNVRDKVDVKLSSATAAELTKRPVEYDTGFTLLPGKYAIKFLARDAETGRIGTYQTEFVIPNLNRKTNAIPISSVVLSSQRVDLKNALYKVGKEKNSVDTGNPLIQNGTKLVPSVTRVFSRHRDIYVYLQAYEPYSIEMHPLIAFVSFYDRDRKVWESQPVKATECSGDRLKTTALQIQLQLGGLSPGKYDSQVTVLDPQGQRAAFWRAPVVLVP